MQFSVRLTILLIIIIFFRIFSILLASSFVSSVPYDEIEERGHKGGGGGGFKKHKGGGYGGGYKPDKCHPQTITKYKTVYKDRKANVVNQVCIVKNKSLPVFLRKIN